MLITSYGEFKKSDYSPYVPVIKEFILDCDTPVSAYLKLTGGRKDSFLLESVEHGDNIGRYSFVGLNPLVTVVSDNDKVTVKKEGKTKLFPAGNILDYIKSKLSGRAGKGMEDMPVCGSFVGYISYENVKYFDDVNLVEKEKSPFPMGIFFLMRDYVVFDHLKKNIKVVTLASSRKREAYDDAISRIAKVERVLFSRKDFYSHKPLGKINGKLVSNFTKDKFEKAVRKAKRYIKEGDVIQVVLSQRFKLGKLDNPFSLYRALRVVNPSPYMFFFKCGKYELIGASPEMLAKKEGLSIQVRPIAGTRKRGRTFKEDKALEAELLADEKEMAEHLMLIDLGRNDLGRCSKYGSVKVVDYARVERYSHVMHIVSEVHGTIGKGKDAFALVKSAFPAGTLSGAPKIRAMEIINELEPVQRGPYGGAMGYFSPGGDMDMCIIIRTVMVAGGDAYLQVGAGIVHDSVPSREYEETINKANAIFKAIEVAEKYF